MKACISCLLILLYFQGFSQRIENLTPILTGENIEITFDLIDTVGGRTFDLQLFSSLDNYTSPLQYVSGDIGEEVSPGTGKKVIWEAKRELGPIKGEVFLEIRGPVTPPFLVTIFPSKEQRIRRGKPTSLTWTSDAGGQVKIEVIQYKKVFTNLGLRPNSGSYTWNIPKDYEKGNYRLRFTDDSGSKIVVSQNFTVRAKFSSVIKAIPVIALGVVIYILLQPPEEERIPDPISPN